MSFQKILDKYRNISFSERDKGDRFERLMQAYLRTDPQYENLFEEVWLWSEFPGNIHLGEGDTGIDLVCKTIEDEYWAVQCKFYKEDTRMSKPSVDSFLSTSSRGFKDTSDKERNFSHRLWISTSNNWGPNAEQALRNQNPPVTRINLFNLADAPVDWDKLESGVHGEKARNAKKTLFDHQREALECTEKHFKENNRGKLIMACGTGKTFTSLRIAENQTNSNGLVLFLVPSIALLGQTLREWSADSIEPINAICICSDPGISKERKNNNNDDIDSFSTVDLAYPASTNPDYILKQFESIKEKNNKGMTVVFSTYQSIDVIAKAQDKLLENKYPEFDLIICDEAHRTTGVSLSKEDESAFTKVHDNDFIKAKKRLYMTATPRLFKDEAKSKAAQSDALLCSMDDKDLYGEEMYRIGFGKAVEKNLLTDYKVLILTINDKDVPPAVYDMLKNDENEITTDDASKIIGTINALSKQFIGDNGETKLSDPNPMKRAVAFCPNIENSKQISHTYNSAPETYIDELPQDKRKEMVSTESYHMDGKMAAPERDKLLHWLKEDTDDNKCRILSNVRVLSEGVDVPSLDAVLFMSARNSEVDVVQSVGRVMRKSPGKKYGYIVIPVVVPSDVDAADALDDNKRYKVVWTVLNALRAHDDRFNATVNKIELNKKRPSNILVGRPDTSFDDNGNPYSLSDDNQSEKFANQLALQFQELQDVVYARMVNKVGTRTYWEEWAKDIAQIAERQVERINHLIDTNKSQSRAFGNFLKGLQKNINPSIDRKQAIDMLAQHIITKPIFEALFEGYSFTKSNTISKAMQEMLDTLEGESLAEENEKLERFYQSVKSRAEGIDNAEGKQKIIIELYDKFFKTALPKMVEQLGIVYTPVEVVDFIIHSVNDVLKKEFDRSISDENVHILDPFTGTGTFITRLLQSGLIKNKDLMRKYKHELHANEIVLLAYYIATINIESSFHDATPNPDDGIGKEEYHPFEGIVLTDTFQLGESDNGEKLFSEMFPQNSERVERQKKAPLRVIMGNPPYSIGQKSANDNAANQKYEKLDARIANTYAELSSAGLNKSLYDAYVKAYRWSSDRLDKKHGGIIGFVTNGKWLDANSTDGFRKQIEKEFSSIYVFDLRGDQRGDWKKEGGKIFGEGSQNRIAITFLIKKPKSSNKAKIYYHNIGDYLSRDEKLSIISGFKSLNSNDMHWEIIEPNEHGDWLKQRNEIFNTFIPIEPKKKFDNNSKSFFSLNVVGLGSNRDAWVYNSSKKLVVSNMSNMIDHYNRQIGKNETDDNSKKIKWTVNLKKDYSKGIKHQFKQESILKSSYRPFNILNLYYDKSFIERPGLSSKVFPNEKVENLNIVVTGAGASKPFSVLITDKITNLDFLEKSQCFPLHFYDERSISQSSLFGEETDAIKKDGITDYILNISHKKYGTNVTKLDVFYYVYGILNSPAYQDSFKNDLKKTLPKIPLVTNVKDFWKFSKSGRRLADLHIKYENVDPSSEVLITGEESNFFNVEKMRFPKKQAVVRGKKKKINDKSIINFNSKISISNIPEKAYEYQINGKSAIEWIMERYQFKTDKNSGIINDPNDWADEVGNPRYILDLLLSIINVSVQTVDIVNGLPKLKFEE